MIENKNLSFFKRSKFALNGMIGAWREEKSFRTQSFLGLGALLLLVFLHAEATWYALFLTCIGGVLSMELVNTSLERWLDYQHPNFSPHIQRAKDCAAGAVLIASLISLGVFLSFLAGHWNLLH